MTLSPCLDCGEPVVASRCNDCTRVEERAQPDRKSSATSRGYDWTWTKLSRRARRLQPFCSDCGATKDLQTDHSEEAWRRKAVGLPVRLADVEVVCGPCNRTRGAQRPNQAPPGGIPAGQTLPTPTPESNFASHIVGSPHSAEGTDE